MQQLAHQGEHESGQFPVQFRRFFLDDLLYVDGPFGDGERKHVL